MLAATAALVAAGPARAGEWDQPQVGPAVSPGDVLVARGDGRALAVSAAGARLGTYQPVTDARAVAATATGVWVARAAPVVMDYLLNGLGHSRRADLPQGTAVTAIAAGPLDVYPAFSDGGYLNALDHYTEDEALFSHTGLLPFLSTAPILAVDVDSSRCVVAYATARPAVQFVDLCFRSALDPLPTATPLAAVRIAPGGTFLVVPVDGSQILRLGRDAKVVRRYDVAGIDDWSAIDVTPNGAGIWAGTRSGAVLRFDLGSGAVAAPAVDVGAPVTSLAVVGAPRWPAAKPVVPPAPERLALDDVPSLTGEGLVGTEGGSDTSLFPCPADAPASFAYLVHGAPGQPNRAHGTGPYPATLIAVSANVTLAPGALAGATGWLGLPPRRVSAVDGSFLIAIGSRVVKGTLSVADATAPNIGSCAIFDRTSFPNSLQFSPSTVLSGFYWSAYARDLAYRARITADSRTYVDTGHAALTAEATTLTDVDRGGNLLHKSQRVYVTFTSDGLTVADAFRSKRQRVAHAAAIPRELGTVRLSVRWKNPSDRFRLANVALEVPARTTAKTSPGKLRITKLRITVRRTKTSLTATVTKLRPGKLSFKVAPVKLGASTTVQTSVAAGA